MAILRNFVNNKFTIIQNELITDTRISAQAFRVACYLLSRPDGWQVYNKDIQNKLGIKTAQALANYWKELIGAGIVHRKQVRGAANRFSGGFEYAVGDVPADWIADDDKSPDYGKTVLRVTSMHIKTDGNKTDRNIEIEHRRTASSTSVRVCGEHGYAAIAASPPKTEATSEKKRLAVKAVAAAGYRYSAHCLSILRDLQANTASKICLTVRQDQLIEIETNLQAIVELDEVDLYQYLSQMIERTTAKKWLNLAMLAGVGMDDFRQFVDNNFMRG